MNYYEDNSWNRWALEVIYGARLLEVLKRLNIITYLLVTNAAEKIKV